MRIDRAGKRTCWIMRSSRSLGVIDMLFKCRIAFDMGMRIGHRSLDLTWTWPGPDQRSVPLRLLGTFTQRSIISFILFFILFCFSFLVFSFFYVETIFEGFKMRKIFLVSSYFFFPCVRFDICAEWLHDTYRGKKKKMETEKQAKWETRAVSRRSPLFGFYVCCFRKWSISFSRSFLSLFFWFPAAPYLPSFEPSWDHLKFCKLWCK